MQAVEYARVSTQAQGRSGLGLEAQQESVRQYCRGAGLDVGKTFVEVETGKNGLRPELAKAIAHAKRVGGRLVIAKLDRLSRNVAFTSALMDSGVEFTCCDNPHANRLTLHVLAAVAENEAIQISLRTKAALAAYKARGGLLGASRVECRNLSAEARRRGARLGQRANEEKARKAYADLLPEVTNLRQVGMTLAGIAEKLNEAGHTTRTGKRFSHEQVRMILKRSRG